MTKMGLLDISMVAKNTEESVNVYKEFEWYWEILDNVELN